VGDARAGEEARKARSLFWCATSFNVILKLSLYLNKSCNVCLVGLLPASTAGVDVVLGRVFALAEPLPALTAGVEV